MRARRGCGEDEKLDHIALTASRSATGSASRACRDAEVKMRGQYGAFTSVLRVKDARRGTPRSSGRTRIATSRGSLQRAPTIVSQARKPAHGLSRLSFIR